MTKAIYTMEDTVGVSQRLQRSIEVNERKYEEILDKLCHHIGHQPVLLKDSIIDTKLNEFKACHAKIEGEFNQFFKQSSTLYEETKQLKDTLTCYECVKNSLDKALATALKKKALRGYEISLRDAMGREDFQRAVDVLLQLKTMIADEDFVNDADKVVIDSVISLKKKLVNYFQHQLHTTLQKKQFQLALNCSRFLSSLQMVDHTVTIYLGVLSESLRQCTLFGLSDVYKDNPSVSFEKNELMYASDLSKLLDTVVSIVGEYEEVVKEALGLYGFLAFLRGTENETGVYVVSVLKHFQRSNETMLKYSRDSLPSSLLRDTDLLLDELSLIALRCHQFESYLHRKGRDTVARILQNDTPGSLEVSNTTYSGVHGLEVLSAMTRHLQELMGYYVSLEDAYAFVSLKKASEEATISIDDPDRVGSTFPDDVFFVLRKIILRSIGSREDFAVCAVINFLTGLVSSVVKSFLCDALHTSCPFYAEWAVSQYAQSGVASLRSKSFLSVLEAHVQKSERLPELTSMLKWTNTTSTAVEPPSSKKNARDVEYCLVKMSFPHLLNDLSTCVDYIHDLVQLTESDYARCRRTVLDSDQGERQCMMFQQSLLSLSATKKEFEQSFNFFLTILVDTVFQPILVKLFHDFNAVSSVIDDATFADYQVNDPFITRFVSHLTDFMSHITSMYSPHCATAVVDAFVVQITLKFEECILNKKFSLLGGVHLEADVRVLMGCLTQYFNRSFLSKFSRLMDTVEILCISSPEELHHSIDPLYAGKTWKLTLEEIQKVAERRIDFSPTVIATLFSNVSVIEHTHM